MKIIWNNGYVVLSHLFEGLQWAEDEVRAGRVSWSSSRLARLHCPALSIRMMTRRTELLSGGLSRSDWAPVRWTVQVRLSSLHRHPLLPGRTPLGTTGNIQVYHVLEIRNESDEYLNSSIDCGAGEVAVVRNCGDRCNKRNRILYYPHYLV